MKNGVRYIAIASGPIEKGRITPLLGVIFRDNYIEGLLSTRVAVDGTDSTTRIIETVKGSRFGEQIRILLFNGIALAGLNIIDMQELERKLHSKVVLLNRRKQNADDLVNALREFSRLTKKSVGKRIEMVESSRKMKAIKANGFFLQSTLDEAYLRRFSRGAFEALRVAHIIASGVSVGESRGRL